MAGSGKKSPANQKEESKENTSLWPMRSRFFDQHFGSGAWDDPFFRFPYQTLPYQARPPCFDAFNQGRMGFSDLINDKDKFAVRVDVSNYKPEEIKVKTVDNQLIIEGNHEEKSDVHGHVKRSFNRIYAIPQGVNIAAMKSNWSVDGVLTIQAPKFATNENQEQRSIPIQHVSSNDPETGQGGGT